MCFVWISEQTAIFSLYSINWLVCITETVSVYCAVQTESLNVTEVKFCLQDGHRAHVEYPPMFQTDHQHAAFTWRRNERSPETSKKQCSSRHCGTLVSKVLSLFYQSSTDRLTFLSQRANQGGLFPDKLMCGHVLWKGSVVTPRRVWHWLNYAVVAAVILWYCVLTMRVRPTAIPQQTAVRSVYN